MLGTRQTGMWQLRVADLERDGHLLPRVANLADRLLADYPDHVQPLIDRWIGEATRYGDV